ncbi:MAG: RluA family pseudouridine synthase [Clostridiales bacterium]|jgi:23S rRNA pseudouridine1911/1915/1917 synthase|nr:RluA family pseudouridine synthase [Clostridiales bacterium]
MKEDKTTDLGYEFKVDKNCKKRLDIFLCEKINIISRSQIKNIIKNGLVKVLNNNNIETKIKCGYILRKNDLVLVNKFRDSKSNIKPEAQKIEIEIIYEDSNILLVNKPQGMTVHPAVGNYKNTLVNALIYYLKDNLSDLNGEYRPGIVHRIDKNTSGLLVIAKNNFSHKFLAEQFFNHSIIREYTAIVCGSIEKDNIINLNISRDRYNRKKFCVSNYSGKCAITEYELIENLGQYSLIKLKLKTGRTHQIRVHMSHIGHSVLGDDVYGGYRKEFSFLKGQMLHAGILGFVHPKTNQRVVFKKEEPEYFYDVIKKIKFKSVY